MDSLLVCFLRFARLNGFSLYRCIKMVLIFSNDDLRKTLLLKLNMSISGRLRQSFYVLRHKKLNTAPEFNNIIPSSNRVVMSECKYFFHMLDTRQF